MTHLSVKEGSSDACNLVSPEEAKLLRLIRRLVMNLIVAVIKSVIALRLGLSVSLISLVLRIYIDSIAFIWKILDLFNVRCLIQQWIAQFFVERVQIQPRLQRQELLRFNDFAVLDLLQDFSDSILLEFSHNGFGGIELFDQRSTRLYHFVGMLFFVELFDTRDADADTVIICELRHSNKILSALRANSCTTPTTMMLPLKETKFHFADEAVLDLLLNPHWPLCNF